MGFGHKILMQTPSLGIQPFHVRCQQCGHLRSGRGWRRNTPETDLIRHHQDLEEGERFEGSDLRLERCCFLALLGVDRLVLSFMEGTEITLSWISLP